MIAAVALSGVVAGCGGQSSAEGARQRGALDAGGDAGSGSSGAQSGEAGSGAGAGGGANTDGTEPGGEDAELEGDAPGSDPEIEASDGSDDASTDDAELEPERTDDPEANAADDPADDGSTTDNGPEIGEDPVQVTPPAGLPTEDTPALDVCQIAPTPSQRTLSHEQYDNTLRDLLGVTSVADQAPSALLPVVRNDVVSDEAWAQYQTAAEAIASEVVSDPDLLINFAGCSVPPTDAPLADDPDTAKCLSEAIPRFGRRAFRRPLSEEERLDFERVLELESAAPPLVVAQALLQAFLASPAFVRREEVQPADAVGVLAPPSSYEIASRLSYLLWGSLPDPVLDVLADAGELDTATRVRAQAERMLADPRARQRATAFHRALLRQGPNSRWTADKDAALFPEVDPELLADLELELDHFFDQLVFGNAGFRDLLLNQDLYVTARTAPLYGLDAAGFGATVTRVEHPDRPGFLTRAGFLTAYSSYTRTSPILRGAFIANDLLGHGLVPPPFAVQIDPPEPDDAIDTVRKYTEVFTAPPECAACHATIINPPGFVLEAYDAIGRAQTVERGDGAGIPAGAPIDTVADVLLDGEFVTIANPAELMLALSESREAREGYVRRWVNFAYERPGNVGSDDCTVRYLASLLAAEDFSLRDLIVELTQTPEFMLGPALDVE